MKDLHLTLLVPADIVVEDRWACSRACPHLRGLGNEFSCVLFERPLLADTGGSRPLRGRECRDAEQNLNNLKEGQTS